MKLKEKLAREASRVEVSGDESIRMHDLAMRMYLVGFEKAREMAIAQCRLAIQEREYVIDRLDYLGESEVEPGNKEND